MKLETVREKQLDAYLAKEDAKDDQKLRLVLKGNPKHLQVYRVPIRYLIYNIRNGRFAAELLAKEGELKRKLDPGRGGASPAPTETRKRGLNADGWKRQSLSVSPGASFVTQRNDWIYLHGAARRNVACE